MIKTNQFLCIWLFLMALFCVNKTTAQCFPGKIVTAAYATGGSGAYKDKILWLTWGSTDASLYPNGRGNQTLAAGAKSYASIALGTGKYLCIEATITSIAGGTVISYGPGTYRGDALDDMYNIGGASTSNSLINGIRNLDPTAQSTVTLNCKASVDGIPVRLSGLVFADAESLGVGESIESVADGKWNIIEMKKTSSGNYSVTKSTVPEGQRIFFTNGVNGNQSAVAFLSFNETAYNKSGTNPDLSVTFTATVKSSSGFQAFALGLLAPKPDFGDAPESYGTPVHLLQNVEATDDKIAANGVAVNVNASAYIPGGLAAKQDSYLGSTAPDEDTGLMFSKDAKGDDNTGAAGPNEEDAWPAKYNRFSYKLYYSPGNNIDAVIPYKNAKPGARIAGWIDFNLNGRFDPEELDFETLPTAGDGTVTLSWKVPTLISPYATYVRLRYLDAAEPGAPSPTNAVNFGEVEDTRMYVFGPAFINPMLKSNAKRKK